ncbi:Uncharacterised protein [Candidatus Ornithobacterium hominis]|uniref:Uncharacterized protein n=1 Tax=Candidatus Ornithobacterium hominis TaxID=2497989 RepID=A0A383TXF7_9FLAO|nr:Uncharacterised protein [Candidatus Ornithobacterium hominis]SZD74369.1 Uncharacterised protein [Candidatus Ornithobacterium hominis]
MVKNLEGNKNSIYICRPFERVIWKFDKKKDKFFLD